MNATPVPLSYEEHGHGTPLMLVHGFPLNRSIWHPLIPLLEDKARLILPDLRGHGQSPVVDGPYSMRELADDLRDLLDRLSIEQAILVGHSMGGYACLNFAHFYPHRLLGLGLMATQAAADLPERRQGRILLAEEVARKGPAALVKSMLPKMTSQPELVDGLRQIFMANSKKSLIASLKGMAERPDALEWLGEIHVPSLVMAGVQDSFIPLERARLMAQLLGRAGLVELPNSAHLPMLEEPQAVADALKELIVSV
jgi:3-oxoadipate enol-lactonase